MYPVNISPSSRVAKGSSLRTPNSRGRVIAFLALPLILFTAGCQPASGQAADEQPISLLTAALPETLNPLAGFDSYGLGKINESLFTVEGEPDQLPNLVPLLAAKEPTISADSLVWDISLSQGIKFSDGTSFDAQDVVASYQAILDPRTASPLAGSLENLESVSAPNEHTVRFRLKEAQTSFKTSLLIGIAPAELADPAKPVAESALSRTPVGTGPYAVEDFSSAQLVLTANPNYRTGPVQASPVIYEAAPDDNARSQRLATGGFTGTVLPPRLAHSFAGRAGYEVLTATSADWRGISLPAEHPFTSDPEVRLALNLAVDREQLIDAVLDGSGRPAYTFVSPEYGRSYAAKATFAHDPERAAALLEATGWVESEHGVRSKDGTEAAFTVLHNPGDTLRRDLSLAVAAQLAELGITVDVRAATFDEAEPRSNYDAIMLGGGDDPYDVDTQLYKMLHSSYPDAGAYYDNPSRYADPAMDEQLHIGRTSLDPDARSTAYRKVQQLYVQQPSMLLLAFLDHSYVQRSDVSEHWDTSSLLLEPHDHGTTWGPWAKIHEWTRKQ
ncbi:ABC transporter substrate-binding protein [Glutamicibacter sp. 363]|uniref:ABC transporter substrate-binding protein n=1 Tax=unclassified Glutamicibacter TaxID=2627139 RepID=UPI004034C8C5